MNRTLINIALLTVVLASCGEKQIEKKGFQVSEITEDENGQRIVGIKDDSLTFETRPRNVLLTAHADHRLTPIYKVNYHPKTKQAFTGSNAYHSNWKEYDKGNNWHQNFMPGFKALYGYNLVNVAHTNKESQVRNNLFKSPVLIKTLYFPANTKDTLNFEPIKRNYYMVSVYDDDTNKDGFINVKDLRRFYYFDINGTGKTRLIPKDYSVMNSEYDEANDYMYIFAKLDENLNGQMESTEPIHIFWLDLKNPSQTGIQYKPE